MFPGYVLIHMIMNDDTWYVVRNTRGVTGFVGPGSKPVPLTDAEMAPLGIQQDNIVVDFEVGDTVQVVAGAWADTVGVIQAMNAQKQSLLQSMLSCSVAKHRLKLVSQKLNECNVNTKRGRGSYGSAITTRR